MRYDVPAKNWTMVLADFIEQTQDGDVIVIASEAAKELAEKAKNRMCPEKKISFKIRDITTTIMEGNIK